MKRPPLLLLLATALASAFAPAAGCTNTASLAGGVGGGLGFGGATTVSTVAAAGGACPGQSTLQRLTATSIDKIDLVLMVDNSRSMADKQQILKLALPDLVTGIVNPECVDDAGNPAANQPPPTSACPAGSHRLVPPVFDMHIGLLSSSLGSFGADACPDTTNAACPNMATSTSNNDHGHLVTRLDPCGPGKVSTWNNEGFLTWDPKGTLSPPGESQIGSTSTPGTLVGDLSELVVGDGQEGCGFESQNESWYRFLVDPSPYQTISLQGQNAKSQGIDNTLLQQRADFLRSDSLLVIVVVTDETDTSLKELSFYPLFAQELENGQPFHLPTARAECVTKGPNDPCCASCGENPPAGCPAEASCTAPATYTDQTENLAIRAFGLSGGVMSHKARYGIEFFYQPSRYIQALTSGVVQDAIGDTVPNPIFSPNATQPAPIRDPSMVLYATITGVPWQLIARQKNGRPDLVNGVSKLDPSQVGGFKTFDELALEDANGNTFWDDVVGDPESYVPPISPFMQESTVPRSGKDPITGASIAPPGTANGDGAVVSGSPLNDHEWNIPKPAGDIEYACIFPILNPIDCSQPGAVCDCDGDPTKNNPLCDPNPNDNGKPTLQSRAKAYPGVKNLAIAKGMRDQGIVASICAKQLVDDAQPDYGYRPAVKAIVEAMQHRIGGQCLREALPTSGGQAQCTLLEATKTTSTCNCDTPGRGPVQSAHLCLVGAVQHDPLAAASEWNCFCEMTQASGAALDDCENDTETSSTTNGWCYIDDSSTPRMGNPALVASCPSTQKRMVRFAGEGAPMPGAAIFLSCQ